MEPIPTEGPRRRRYVNRFRIGVVLGNSFSIWFANLVPFLLLALLVYAPYAALTIWITNEHPDWLFERWWTLTDMVADSLVGQIVSAALIFSVFQKIRGRRVGFGTAIARGLSALPSVIAVGLVIGFATLLTVLPMLAFGDAVGSSADVGTSAACGVIALYIACLVGAAVLTCGLFVAVPVCVVERPGVIRSISRSWELTQRSKFRIFLMLFLIGVLSTIVIMIGSAIVASAVEVDPWTALENNTYLQTIVGVVFASLSAVIGAVAYHELRTAVDGVDADELAAVFD